MRRAAISWSTCATPRGNSTGSPALARDLVRLRMDVIVAISAAAARAVKAATTTIPIVLYGNLDPVAAGLVKSLAKPEGNVTGVLIAPAGTLAAKKLELLKEAVPGADPDRLPRPLGSRHQAPGAGDTAGRGDARHQARRHRGPGRRLRARLRRADAERPEALFVGAHTFFVRDRKRIIALAAKHRLPAMYEWPEQVEDGGLMSYGSSLPGTTRRVAESTWTGSSRAPGPATCRSSSPPSSSS